MDMKSGVTWPEGNEEGTSDIKPKFTGGRAAGGCGKYGWSDDGLVRFNELIALVKKDQSDHETWDRLHDEKRKGQRWRKYRLVATNASGDLNRSSRGQ
jgi:hypothetical protein